MANSAASLPATGAYDALDRIGVVRSNGGTVATTRSYGTYSGQLTSHLVMSGAAQVYGVQSLQYLGDKLQSFTDTGATTAASDDTRHSFAYDLNGRLVQAKAVPQGAQTGLMQSRNEGYGFQDPAWLSQASVGNLERVSTLNASDQVVSSTDYNYKDDRVLSMSGGTGASFTYDELGRTTSKTAGSVITTYGFDVEDHLKSILRTGSPTEALEYGPSGELLWRRVGTSVSYYVGANATATGYLASEACTYSSCTPTSVKVQVHVLLGGARVATVRSTAPGAILNSDILYYHRDRQGSVVATTVTGGYLGAQYRYGPYGQLDKQSVPLNRDSDLGYTGGLRLSGGLILLGARVYDPEARRWVQADDVDLLRYTYAAGDPANLTDPTGRSPLGGDEQDRVCIGGWCVNPVTATFFMERTFGYCTGAAACQLMLGASEHDRRVANRIQIIQRVKAYERYLDSWAAFLNSIPPEDVGSNTGSLLDGDGYAPAPSTEQNGPVRIAPGIVVRGDALMVRIALAYLRLDPVMAGIIERLSASDDVLTIDTSQPYNGVYHHQQREVFWSPYAGAVWEGGSASPALVLGHELAHADGWSREMRAMSAGAYGNMEEFRVITGAEWSAARTLGEGVRTHHQASWVQVSHPLERPTP